MMHIFGISNQEMLLGFFSTIVPTVVSFHQQEAEKPEGLSFFLFLFFLPSNQWRSL